MACCETNHDGKVDYIAFTDRFHEPAKEIGFNLAVLLTNLSEHMPNEPRLAKFLETAGSVLNYFESFLGRIEIMGSSKRIERVYFEIKEDNIEQWEKPQIKESKRAFFYSIVTEGGDKEKLEAFVNFCEDAIFEMTHATELMATEDESSNVNREYATNTYIGDDDEDPSAKDPVKRTIQNVKEGFKTAFVSLSPGNIKHQIAVLQTKTVPELIVGFFKMIFYAFYYSGYGVSLVIKFFVNILMSLMRGPVEEEAPPPTDDLLVPALPSLPKEEPPGPVQAFGVDISKEDNGQYKLAPHQSLAGSPTSSIDDTGESSQEEGAAVGVIGEQTGEQLEMPMTLVDLLGGEAAKRAQQEREEAQKLQQATLAALDAENKKGKDVSAEPAAVNQIDFSSYTKKAVSFLARNFYNLKYVALVLAFCINFMLLFYKVRTFGETEAEVEGSGDSLFGLISGSGAGSGGGGLDIGSGAGSGDGVAAGDDDVSILDPFILFGYRIPN